MCRNRRWGNRHDLRRCACSNANAGASAAQVVSSGAMTGPVRERIAPHLLGTMGTATLDLAQCRWLDRMAETYDDYELFPDMRRLGEILPAIVAGAVDKTRSVEAHPSLRPAPLQRNRAAPIAA